MIKALSEKLKKKKKGFTLIELIIVIAIIAIIAVIAIPKFGKAQKNAKISADKANAKTIANAISKEITEDNIKTGSTITIDFSKDNSETNPIEQVKNSIQSIPVPKYYKDAHFEATIDKDGNVTVSVKGNKEGSEPKEAIEVYPEPTDEAYKE
ncbi:prepilin-type N-terminal cleavage/methylation domain-containing protein [Clostridium cochlearium]|uniref:prepilin-type N-terminal cleavage/methylation domain-containing protein n=1 Tax=Clostridium cochlearium TaxID=1494 RepID=UPI0022E30601|nr:prepilin-type N-terminal cleavage/methylation domain-containing protein [Clostridium cochlearium]